MTNKNNSIIGLVIVLAIIVGLISGLLSYKYNPVSINNNNDKENISNNQILIFNSKQNKSSNRVLVNDKFVAKLDRDSNIVVMGEDGSLYSVKNGAILVSGVVINVKDDSYSVYKINSPEKSVSTD